MRHRSQQPPPAVSQTGRLSTSTPPAALLGTLSPDPLGTLLGTGFVRFRAPSGVHGLARIEAGGTRLAVLAIVATHPGTGQLRQFIRAAQGTFRTIEFIEVWSARLETALARYGFTRGKRVAFESRAGLHIWRWRKPGAT